MVKVNITPKESASTIHQEVQRLSIVSFNCQAREKTVEPSVIAINSSKKKSVSFRWAPKISLNILAQLLNGLYSPMTHKFAYLFLNFSQIHGNTFEGVYA